MAVKFVHLLTHTEYSLVDGICRIKPMVQRAKASGLAAQAMTDRTNLFGMVKFYRAAMAAGIKPIVGADVWISHDVDDQEYRMVLLCLNNTGYHNLTHLISQAYLSGRRSKTPLIDRSWLTADATKGLIALSGAQMGDVGSALLRGEYDAAMAQAKAWQALFPDRYYLELQRVGKEGEEEYLEQAVKLAGELNLPVVATNDVCFLEADDFIAHETRVCIHDGEQVGDENRDRRYTTNQYLRSPEEMIELFADYPEAIANTVEIAKRCNVELTLGKNFLPRFPVPEGMNEDTFLAAKAQEGLQKRMQVLFADTPEILNDVNHPKHVEYTSRLQVELDVIIKMGFPGYFLIVADFIAWGKQHGVPVGPGRGSGAGSLVAYALEITDLDPLEYDLLFERFLNPERVSMPDFDVDFCMDKRDSVIEYVAQQYGKDSVSQIITFGTMAAKAVVRDVGRVLGQPYGFVDKIAKLIPFEIGITLTKALEQEEMLLARYNDEPEVKELIDLAKKLEGITRNAGKHAGGVVISPSLLTDYTPLYCEEGGSNLVSQFDKDDVEAVGLVKFDFLGLRTLTIIDWALQYIADHKQEKPDIARIPLDDPDTFSLLKACQTTAVFQLESRGMKDLIKRLQPDCFEDIVALVALFRPGPLQSGMVDDFINRKHGRAKVEYPHPDLEPILKPTYGVILYQEQVMQIAQVLAGYTLGGADMLRRAMGKKKPEEMAKQRTIFTEGAVGRGVEKDTATYIFDLMEKFAGYGFNKSHSAAYALVSYQTAWLKAHYPACFMASVLSADMDNTEKVVSLVEECRHMEVEVKPPSINESGYRFAVSHEGSVVYGLGAIKGVGQNAIESVIEARQQQGLFNDLFELCERLDLKKVNRRVLEALIKAGAMDCLPGHRGEKFTNLDNAIKHAEQIHKNAAFGQGDLFAGLSDAEAPVATQVAQWTDEIRLRGEKETLGLYLTGHPIKQYEPELRHMVSSNLARVRPEKGAKVTICGLVLRVRSLRTKKGSKMAVVTIEDRSCRMDITLFPEVYDQNFELLESGAILVFVGEASLDDFSGQTRVSADTVYQLDEAREKFAKQLRICLQESQLTAELVATLGEVIAPNKGGPCRLVFECSSDTGRLMLQAANDWSVSLSDELLPKLERICGSEAVNLDY